MVGAWFSPQTSLADSLPFGPAKLAILSADGKKNLGFVDYHLIRVEGGADLRGEGKLTDGEHDTESARLVFSSDDQIPIMARYKHTFFDARGTPQLITQADFKTGVASCTQFKGGKVDTSSTVLTFPPDTYAGASLIVPLTLALRKGQRTKIRFHAFSCVPEPRVIEVEANVKSGASRWAAHSGELVEVEGKPYFGWLTLLASPFLPKFVGWFDPGDDWQYMGGSQQRYYKGPTVEMVRVEPIRSAPSGGMVSSAPQTELHKAPQTELHSRVASPNAPH